MAPAQTDLLTADSFALRMSPEQYVRPVESRQARRLTRGTRPQLAF